MKYIKCKLFNNLDVVVMFSKEINHCDIAAKLGVYSDVKSAGFVGIDKQGHIKTYGRSESLDVDGDYFDSVEIECQLQPMI